MAIMQKPEDLNPADATKADVVVPLEEDCDVEAENLEYSGVAAYVESQFRRSKDDRLTDEERWLTSYRNYRGLYGPDVQFTDTEKSQAFVKIIKTKVLAAYAQVVDVLMAGSKFPIGIEPRNYPSNVADAIYFDAQALTDEKVQETVQVDYKVPPQSPVRTWPKTLASMRNGFSVLRPN